MYEPPSSGNETPQEPSASSVLGILGRGAGMATDSAHALFAQAATAATTADESVRQFTKSLQNLSTSGAVTGLKALLKDLKDVAKAAQETSASVAAVSGDGADGPVTSTIAGAAAAAGTAGANAKRAGAGRAAIVGTAAFAAAAGLMPGAAGAAAPTGNGGVAPGGSPDAEAQWAPRGTPRPSARNVFADDYDPNAAGGGGDVRYTHDTSASEAAPDSGVEDSTPLGNGRDNGPGGDGSGRGGGGRGRGGGDNDRNRRGQFWDGLRDPWNADQTFAHRSGQRIGQGVQVAMAKGAYDAFNSMKGADKDRRDWAVPISMEMTRLGLKDTAEVEDLREEFTNGGGFSIGNDDYVRGLGIQRSMLGGSQEGLAELSALRPEAGFEGAARTAAGMDGALRNRLMTYGGQGMQDSPEQVIQLMTEVMAKSAGGYTAEGYAAATTVGEGTYNTISYLAGGDKDIMEAATLSYGKQAGVVDEYRPEVLAAFAAESYKTDSTISDLDDNLANIEATAKVVLKLSEAFQSNNWLRKIVSFVSDPKSHIANWAIGDGEAVTPTRTARGAAYARSSSTPDAAPVVSPRGQRGAAYAGTLSGDGDVGDPPTPAARVEAKSGSATFDAPVVATGTGAPMTPFADRLGTLMGAGVGDPPTSAKTTIRTNKPMRHVMGLSRGFRAKLEAMFAANPSLNLNSGYRSSDEQAVLFKQAVRKYGSESAARKHVAPPGKSKHNLGLAADVGPSTQYDWIRRNASRFGLHLPMAHEPWHLELKGSRSGKEEVELQQMGEGSRTMEDVADAPTADKDDRVAAIASEGAVIAALSPNSASEGVGSGAGDASETLSAPAAARDGWMARFGGKGRGGNTGGGSGGGTGANEFVGSMAERATAVAKVASRAGFTGHALRTMVAIALGESSGNPNAFNGNAKTGDKSYGLWQINMLGKLGPARMQELNLNSEADLFNPDVNAKAAYRISGGGTNFQPWSVFKNRDHTKWLDEASAGIASAGVGDPPTSGGGSGGGGSGGTAQVAVSGGSTKTVNMYVTAAGGAEGAVSLAREVARILKDKEDFQLVGAT